MIDTEKYKKLMDGYGDVASWAIWSSEGNTPKSNVGDMSIFTDDICDKLNHDYVFVGLNRAEHMERPDGYDGPWQNFHSPDPKGNDFKLRFALSGTKYWGAYMTDIIKHHVQTDSGSVMKYLRNHPDVVKENIEDFEKEISILGSYPVLVAFGNDTFKVLTTYLPEHYRIIRVPHFSFTISKENYRAELLQTLSAY
ncbi:MAG: hypothetical protein K6E85_04530 [Lachnospiraceae bacterium]|nr:hypothetical protein [Lachnospiraceae bacterium]